MAGALTANTIDARLADAVGTEDPLPIADVAMLSPVDGANNVLLTGVVMVTEFEEVDEITFQWYRSSIAASIEDDVLGDAVGDPFIVATGDSELILSPVVVQAIDRGPSPASGYALTAYSPDGLAGAEGVYADAVLYD